VHLRPTKIGTRLIGSEMPVPITRSRTVKGQKKIATTADIYHTLFQLQIPGDTPYIPMEDKRGTRVVVDLRLIPRIRLYRLTMMTWVTTAGQAKKFN
jgi:hypothetical protein